MINLIFQVLTITSLLFIIGCDTGTNKSRNRVNTTTTNQTQYIPPTPQVTGNGGTDSNTVSAGVGYGDGTEQGISDGGQTINYYSLNNIVVHGTFHPNRFPPPNGIPWSSSTGIASGDQAIFTTNSRFNIRVRAQKGPPQNSSDVRNIPCTTVSDLYQKLEVTLCLRSANGTCIYTHTFSNIPVGEVSKTKEFNVPGNTSDPLVLEVLDVQSDHFCKAYTSEGYPDVQGYCPFSPGSDIQCMKFDIQFSTDTTKDLPGPRY